MSITANIRRISSVSLYQAPPSAMVNPVRIPEKCENIEVLTGGKVYFELNGSERVFEKGTIFWHMPGEFTIWKTTREAPYQCLSIRVSTREAPMRQIPRVSFWDRLDELDSFAANAVKSFHDDSIDRDILSPYIYTTLFWQAYYCTRRKPDPGYPQFLRKLLYYINNHLSDDISMDTLSSVSEMSIPYIHAMFKKHLGMSPHRHILSRRLQKARNMLAGSPLMIKEISAECGFENIESFYRAFKKYFRTTPGEYRQRNSPYSPQ